jgi:hypothetical protein
LPAPGPADKSMSGTSKALSSAVSRRSRVTCHGDGEGMSSRESTSSCSIGGPPHTPSSQSPGWPGVEAPGNLRTFRCCRQQRNSLVLEARVLTSLITKCYNMNATSDRVWFVVSAGASSFANEVAHEDRPSGRRASGDSCDQRHYRVVMRLSQPAQTALGTAVRFCSAEYSGWRGGCGVTVLVANQLRASGELVPLSLSWASSSSRSAPYGGSLPPYGPCQPVRLQGARRPRRAAALPVHLCWHRRWRRGLRQG